MSEGEFSVVQFFKNGQYEYVRRNVSELEAAEAFRDHTSYLAVNLGVTERVIIVDGGDFTNVEWIAGKGYSYDGVNYQPSPHTSLHPNVKEQTE